MNKYYKAEDIIRKRAEDLADTSYWEYGNPKNVDDWIEIAEMEFADIPTIEVMEYPQVEGITPTLVTIEPQTERPCDNCQEWDCYGCEYKQTENIKATCDMVGSKNEKVGEWKWISPAGIYQCSVCGGTVMTQDIECYEYCHRCGAKIKGYKNE